jgi:hypothetical protein
VIITSAPADVTISSSNMIAKKNQGWARNREWESNQASATSRTSSPMRPSRYPFTAPLLLLLSTMFYIKNPTSFWKNPLC